MHYSYQNWVCLLSTPSVKTVFLAHNKRTRRSYRLIKTYKVDLIIKLEVQNCDYQMIQASSIGIPIHSNSSVSVIRYILQNHLIGTMQNIGYYENFHLVLVAYQKYPIHFCIRNIHVYPSAWKIQQFGWIVSYDAASAYQVYWRDDGYGVDSLRAGVRAHHSAFLTCLTVNLLLLALN